MTSLYRRASGPQARMLKIISGAVLNAAHAHPGHPVNERFARSCAKRATGTISSQWRELLAAATPSGAGRTDAGSLRNGSHSPKTRGGGHILRDADPRFAREIIREISRRIGPAKQAGETARAEALIEALRIVDRVKRG